jgi:hypothetical protein
VVVLLVELAVVLVVVQVLQFPQPIHLSRQEHSVVEAVAVVLLQVLVEQEVALESELVATVVVLEPLVVLVA